MVNPRSILAIPPCKGWYHVHADVYWDWSCKAQESFSVWPAMAMVIETVLPRCRNLLASCVCLLLVPGKFGRATPPPSFPCAYTLKVCDAQTLPVGRGLFSQGMELRGMADMWSCPAYGGMINSLLIWFGGIYLLHLCSWNNGAAVVLLWEGCRSTVPMERVQKQMLVNSARFL